MRVLSSGSVALLLTLTACGGCPGPGGTPDGGDSGPLVYTPDANGFCSDRKVEAPEECDDGNRVSGDGCSATCISEEAQVCSADGVVDLLDAGVSNGLLLAYAGTTKNKRNALEPPTGCQEDALGGGGPEVAHRLNLPVKADLLYSTGGPGTELDTVLYQVDQCTPGRAPEGSSCNDDIAPLNGVFQSTLLVPAVEPGEHFVVVDSFDLRSSETGSYQLDVQIRPVVGLGGRCDVNRLSSRCDDGFVCPSDAGPCETGAPPQLDALEYLNLGSSTVRLVMSGRDLNGDVQDYILELLDNLGQPIAVGGQRSFPLAFDRSVQGLTAFVTSGTLNLTGLTPLPPQARVRLRDLSNFEGTKLTASLTPISDRALAAACDAKKVKDRCVTGSACKEDAPGSDGGTCAAGTAPTLTAARAYGAPDRSRRVAVDGTDPDGDITRMVLTFKNAQGAAVALDVDGDQTAETPSVAGFGQVVGTTTLAAITGLREALFPTDSTVTQVSVKLRDATGLESGELTVPFNGLAQVGAGGSCDPRRWDNYCGQAAPRCDGNVCTASATSAATACGGAQTLTVGTPVTGALILGPDRWRAPCSDTSGSAASEKVFKFTTTQPVDLKFTTDFPETTLDTVVYLASGCAETLSVASCSDDIDQATNLRSEGFVRALPAGTHYLFVDAWTSGTAGAGTGDFKLLVTELPVLTASGVACDPLLRDNRCAEPLRCRPDAAYTSFTCR